MIRILLCIFGAWLIAIIARDTVSRDSAVPFGILSFTLLLFATGAV